MRTWLLALGVCVGALSGAHTVSAEPVWRTAVTPNYRVFSQLSDRDTSEWMRGFDQFIFSTSDVLHLNLHATPPLTVIIFAHDTDYQPYKPLRPNGRVANIAGQFVRRSSWSMISMAHDADSQQLRAILQHEATHWLMSSDPSPQPAWFTEGIAEMFSTFELGVDTVNWAKPISAHLDLLRERGTTPLAPFLAEPSAIFDQDNRQEIFYAQAWAFTDFLMLSNKAARRPQLVQFLNAFRTKSGDEAVKEVFGTELTGIQKELAIYVDQRSFPYFTFPKKPAGPPPALTAAAPAQVEASLGFLALGASLSQLARQHAEKAIAIDDGEPGGHAVLAYLELDNRDMTKAAIHAEAALQRGSKDSELFLIAGDSYAGSGRNAGQPNATATAVQYYENSINANPRSLEAFDRLAGALVNLSAPREEDGKFMDLGLKAFPTDDWLRVSKAAIDYRLGQQTAAMTALDSVLQPGNHLDGYQDLYATGLRKHWLIDAMNVEIRAAMDKKDIGATRAVIAHYREVLGNDSATQDYLNGLTKQLDDVDHRKAKPRPN
jgi:tetratricopeptide (TPR) repeat protein